MAMTIYKKVRVIVIAIGSHEYVHLLAELHCEEGGATAAENLRKKRRDVRNIPDIFDSISRITTYKARTAQA